MDDASEVTDATDAPPRQLCPGGEGDCGWRCCRGSFADVETLRRNCYGGLDPHRDDTNLKFYDAELVTAENLATLPPLSDWTWRPDGTQMAVLDDFSTCRWGLECQDWCWQPGYLVYVLDVQTGRQLHVEAFWDLGAGANPGYPDWPYSLGAELSPPYPYCPGSGDWMSFGGICRLVDVPGRGIGYGFRNIAFRDDLERRLSDLPFLRGAVDIYDLSTLERIGTIDLTVPEMHCTIRTLDDC
jgi:hypothetical protein